MSAAPLACVALVAAETSASAAPQSCTTEIVDVDNSGNQVLGQSGTPAVSSDGRFVAFDSNSPLAPGDTDSIEDIYIRDRLLGITELVSVNSNGVKGNAASSMNAMTPDGRFVVFSAYATNLVSSDTNSAEDVFVHDRVTGQTWRASVGNLGQEGNHGGAGASISVDGRYVAFSSSSDNLWPGDTNGASDVFVYDHTSGTSNCISVNSLGVAASGGSADAHLSGDGRAMAFWTISTEILGGCGLPTGNGIICNLTLGTYECLGVTPSGAASNFGAYPWGLSADGRFVVFTSDASNLVVGDTNGVGDAFVRDRLLAVTLRVSLASTGAQANAATDQASISANGRFVAFESSASNLVPNDGPGWDIFVRDTQAQTTTLVSQGPNGEHGNSVSLGASISADGTVIGFDSDASNFVPNDLNGNSPNVFVRACPPSAPFEYCVAKPNSLSCRPSITFNGSPSASVGSGFDIGASSVLNNKFGLLFYSKNGETLTLFKGGFLCVKSPIQRTSIQSAGGTPPPTSDCTGHYHRDFNAYIASGVDPALVAGQEVWAQYWSRDPGFASPNNTGLTDALEFTIGL